MRSVLHIIYILIGAILGALFGFPIANFINHGLAAISLSLIQAIAAISLIFVDELNWVSFLFNIHDFFFEFEASFPSVFFYIKTPPLIFYIILVLYETFWGYFYLKMIRENEEL